MKLNNIIKITSAVLAFILALGCFAVYAAADDAAPASEKFDYTVTEAVKQIDDSYKLQVSVSYKIPVIPDEELDDRAYAICGIRRSDWENEPANVTWEEHLEHLRLRELYMEAVNQAKKEWDQEQRAAVRAAIIESLGVDSGDVVSSADNYHNQYGLMLRLNKAQLYRAAADERITYIYCDPFDNPGLYILPPHATYDEANLLEKKFVMWAYYKQHGNIISDPEYFFGGYDDTSDNYDEEYCQGLYCYDEIYLSYKTSGGGDALDWALINANIMGPIELPWDMRWFAVIGSRVLVTRPGCVGPGTGFMYYLYSARDDAFHTPDDVDPDEYDGLSRALEDLDIGRPFGDADRDNELSVLDATLIQRGLAQLEQLPEDEYLDMYTAGDPDSPASRWYYFADADTDGEVTVMDATRIQRRLADIE